MAYKEYNNELGDVTWFSKYELAETQLLKAIRLFLDDKDYICAITLASAAEEILGKILNNDGSKNAIDDYIESFLTAGVEEDLKDYKQWFVKELNFHRDNLKHLVVQPVKNSPYPKDLPPTEIPVYAAAVRDVIHRALKNHSRLNKESMFFSKELDFNINRFYDSEQ